MNKSLHTAWKIIKTVLLTLLVIAVLLAALYFFLLLHGLTRDRSTADLSEYGRYLDTDEGYPGLREIMPALEDCGEYRGGAVALRRHRSMFPFNACALVLNYGAEGYAAQKAALLERTDFFAGPTQAYRDVEAEWNGFFVRPVALEGRSGADEVKLSLLIGFDDDAQTILYAAFENTERDEIDDLGALLDEYFFLPKELGE